MDGVEKVLVLVTEGVAINEKVPLDVLELPPAIGEIAAGFNVEFFILGFTLGDDERIGFRIQSFPYLIEQGDPGVPPNSFIDVPFIGEQVKSSVKEIQVFPRTARGEKNTAGLVRILFTTEEILEGEFALLLLDESRPIEEQVVVEGIHVVKTLDEIGAGLELRVANFARDRGVGLGDAIHQGVF